MIYIIAGLAVYKLIQLLDSLSPREAMPWVKVLVGVAFGYGAAYLVQVEHPYVAGMTIAAVASAWHGVMRLVTLLGDMALRKAVK